MNIHSLVTQRTARVVSAGNINPNTRYIWLIAHGYGMLAQYFIKKFEALPEEHHYLVVPEALSRAYLEGLTGRVGASWMTKEDREAELADQRVYLDLVYEQLIQPNIDEHTQVVALGFSQGVATILRWANQTDKKIDKLVAWAGSIPPDVLAQCHISHKELYLVVGDKDPFLPQDNIAEYIRQYQSVFSHLDTRFFDGDHNIYTEPLMDLVQNWA